MPNLVKVIAGSPTLAERLKKHIQPHTQPLPTQCLLVDVSGSMLEDCEPGKMKITAVKQICRDFPGVRQFSFSMECKEEPPDRALGSTNLAGAFIFIKEKGITHCVLITDGYPDSETDAMIQAKGLTIDIIYVGPPPAPQFLARLAQATGGQYGSGNLTQTKAIEQKLQLLLERK